MNNYKSIIIGLMLIACAANLPVMATQLPCEAKLALAAIPQDAFYLPESQAAQLQKTLNTHGSVRLKPGGNYTKSFSIKLGSKQALYGLAGTKLPQVTIPAGTSNAILSGVSPVKISFEGFTKPITGNCLSRISNSSIEANNVLLENNLFADLSNVTIESDTAKKGYLKNNRFIRTMVHAAFPAISIIGNSVKQSQGNTFIFTNIMTPQGDSIIIKNQKNVSFVGIDAEAWNWDRIALYPGMMNILNTDFLSVFMSEGGDNHNKTGQYFNLDAKNIVMQGMRIGATKNPGIILGVNVENILTVDIRDIGIQKPNASTQVIDILKQNNSPIVVNQETIEPKNLSTTTKNTISNILQAEKNTFSTWQKPVFRPIPDPAGSKWQANLINQPDSADTIQALIDQNGIAELKSGIYYIGKPLLLKAGQGIIGAGADKTVIIAKSPTIDLIAGATHFNVKTITTTFVLADLTLQGGLNGIHHSAQGSGKGAQYNLVTLSHVTIRNMANAGILIDNIYAWDNNFIDHSNFYRCKTGIKQRPDPAYVRDDHIGMTYLDKNVFYQTQFIENEIPIDWQAKRANNLNAFVNCLFKNNKLAINQIATSSTFFANSIFETASEQPLLTTNEMAGFVNSYFVSTQSNHYLLGDNVICNHCRFDNSAPNSASIVSPNSKHSFFINNMLSKAVNQTIDTGLIINSNFSNITQKPIMNSLFINKTGHPF